MKKKMIKALLVFSLSCLFTMTAIQTCSHQSVVHQDDIVPYVAQERTDKHYAPEIRIITDNSTMCSAVVIDDHYALSAAHCSQTFLGKFYGDIEVYDFDGQDTFIKATFVAVDREKDIGLVKGDFRNFNTRLVVFNNIDPSLSFKACGFPSNTSYYCSTIKIVGNYDFEYRAQGLPIFKGMSGGGVYDYKGRVVGINSAVMENYIIIGPLVGLDQQWGLQ